MCAFTFCSNISVWQKSVFTILAMLQFYRFSKKTTVHEYFIMTAVCLKFEQRHMSATQNDYWYPWMWIALWTDRISTIGYVLSLLNFTTIYWLLRCMTFISPTKVKKCIGLLSGLFLGPSYTLSPSFRKIRLAVFRNSFNKQPNKPNWKHNLFGGGDKNYRSTKIHLLY